jgi:hypothetical protein
MLQSEAHVAESLFLRFLIARLQGPQILGRGIANFCGFGDELVDFGGLVL